MIKSNKGGMSFGDIFTMLTLLIVFFVFITVWNPILAIFDFSNMTYGSVIELLLNLIPLIVLAVFISAKIGDWTAPSNPGYR